MYNSDERINNHYLIINTYILLLMQKQKPQEKNKKPVEEVTYKLFNSDFQDLFINLEKAPKSLQSDLNNWSKRHDFRSYFVTNMSSWFKQKENYLFQSAKKAHNIIDSLVKQIQIPLEVIIWYMEYLTSNRNTIEKQLNLKQAEKLFWHIPIQLVIDYLALYKIELTEKEKNSLVKEVAEKANKISQRKIKNLPRFLGDPKKYGSLLFQELFHERRNDLLGDIFKTYKLSLEDYKLEQGRLLQGCAISMPKWKDSKAQGFTFDRVEQVFEGYPSAIAASIKVYFRNKKMTQKEKQIIASIVHRNPAIPKSLPNDIKNQIKGINKFIQNQFRTNLFEPSDPKKYLTFQEFGIEQKDVIMVTEDNIELATKEVFTSDIIGIDTESTVARTSLNTNIDLLSIVQISIENKVYIFDAKILIHKPYESKEAAQFFKDPKKLIVGHTLGADLNGDVTRLFGYKDKVQCKAVDICVVFKKCIPDRRPGLASIAETLLEKGICKEYTLTNWDRRPLLRNQIHYAAMDAFIVLKLWEILEQLQKKEDAKRLKQKEEKKEKEGHKQEKILQKKSEQQQHTDLQQSKLQQKRQQ